MNWNIMVEWFSWNRLYFFCVLLCWLNYKIPKINSIATRFCFVVVVVEGVVMLQFWHVIVFSSVETLIDFVHITQEAVHYIWIAMHSPVKRFSWMFGSLMLMSLISSISVMMMLPSLVFRNFESSNIRTVRLWM